MRPSCNDPPTTLEALLLEGWISMDLRETKLGMNSNSVGQFQDKFIIFMNFSLLTCNTGLLI